MEKKRNSLLVQGSILAMAGILTKIIGFLYRIPMANLLGEQGNGIYSVAFGIYNVALTLSSYSLPLAVSKLVSSRLAKDEKLNAYVLFKRALLFAVIAGSCAFCVLFFGAEWLEALYSRAGLADPLRVLAPTAFIVALLGVFRGYFQGHSNMVPTAASQIVEQIINAVVSIVATYGFMQLFVADEQIAAKGAAGATMGTLAGAFGALVMLSLFFASRMKSLKTEVEGQKCTEKKRTSFTDIVTTMIPIVLSQSIYQIGFTVDDFIYGNVMSSKGMLDTVAGSQQGVFNTQYTQLINLPIAIATALAASALPGIASLYAKGRHAEKNDKINGVIKLTAAIAIPSAVGLAVLARPIITVMFPGLTEYKELAIRLLQYGSSACVFYSLATITTSVLQGNDKMRIPVINSFASFILHVIIVFPLLKFTDLSVYALLIGDVTFPLVIAILNITALNRKTGYRPALGGIFIKPIIASAVMGLTAWGSYSLLGLLNLPMIICFAASFGLAVVVYAVLVLVTKAFNEEEMLDLPMGGRLLAVCKKIKLYQ